MDPKREDHYKDLSSYAQRLHERNKKRVRTSGIVLVLLPVVLGLIRWLTDSDKFFFLNLWVLGMFLVSAYLIGVEYMDHKLQRGMMRLTDHPNDEESLVDGRNLVSEDAKEKFESRHRYDIIVHDFRKLTSSVVALVILMGIIVVPCLFAWFNILSNDDPFKPQSTSRIPVAVATEDEGAQMLGMHINVGEKFIDAVNGDDNVGWEVLDAKEKAVEGVRAGDYYAAVIIPEDFSEDVLSFCTGELRHPVILFYENEKTNAIAPKITDKVGSVLEEEANQAFIDTIGSYITEAAYSAQAAGKDPQDAFRDLSDTMGQLDANLESAMVIVRSASGISDAAATLLEASDDLIDSSQDTIALGEQLLDSAEEDIPQKADTTSAEKAVKDIIALLSKDLTKISEDLEPARNNMDKYNQYVQNELQGHKDLVTSMKSSTDKVVKRLEDMGLTGLASRFSRISDKLGSIIDTLNKLETADETNWTTMQGYIDAILSNAESTQDSLVRIQNDVNGELDKKMNQAIRDARKSISAARDSLSGIYGNMDLLEESLSRSNQTLGSLQSGLSGTMATLTSLQNGTRNVAELFDSLADSDLVADVNHLMTNDAAVIAENMAAPIKMKTEEIYPTRNFGSVMASFYTVIALWIGALFAAVMIHVQVKRKEDEPLSLLPGRQGSSGYSLCEAFFGRYRVFLTLGLAQAVLVTLGNLLYVDIQCLHPLLFLLAACVISIVFTLIIYSLVFAFENLGLALSVIIMILQVAGSGGTFPVEVLPPVFRAMFPFMPFKYAMDAMRECVSGSYGHTYLKCLGILLLFGAAAIGIGLLLYKPMKGLIEKVEESKSESDVML